MSNLSDLKDALTTAAASITDAMDKAECLADIDSWYACRTAVDAFETSNVQSYSMSGRSVSRASLPDIKTSEREYWSRIQAKLYYKGASLLDMSGDTDA